jgi:histidinol phosphatase-like enzyme
MTIDSPNVKGIWATIEVDEEGTETVLIVETDLELNAAHPAFNAAKVDALIEAATKSFAASGGTFDRIHLVPITKPAVKKVRKPAKKVQKKVGPKKNVGKKAKKSAKKSGKEAPKKAKATKKKAKKAKR